MKRKILSMWIVLCMLSALASGCKAEEEIPIAENEETHSTESEAFDASEEASSELNPAELLDTLMNTQGQVYNIYTYDRNLIDLMRNYVPNYMTAAEHEEAESMPPEAFSEASSVPSDMEAEASSFAEVPAVSSDKSVSANEILSEDGVSLIRAWIGDIEVCYHVIDDNLEHYQDVLDEALINRDENPDERVDLFLVNGELAPKYCDRDADVTKTLQEIGISQKALNRQYEFTKTIVTDEDGAQRGAAWEAACGVFVYRRAIAQEVLGTDNPVQIQNEISDWSKFDALAQRLGEQHYQMLSGANDAYYAHLSCRKEGWINDKDQLQVDAEMAAWVRETKEFSDAGYHHQSAGYGSESWQQDMKPGSSVFGFFLTSQDALRYLLPNATEGLSEEDRRLMSEGDPSHTWGVCRGPAPSFQGGDWLCAARESDNDKLSAEIIKTLTTDETVMTEMAKASGTLVNDQRLINAVGSDAHPLTALFGGQAYLQIFDLAARDLDVGLWGYYDNGIDSIFLSSFAPYVKGQCTEEEALQTFYRRVMDSYPDLLSA